MISCCTLLGALTTIAAAGVLVAGWIVLGLARRALAHARDLQQTTLEAKRAWEEKLKREAR